MLNHIREDRIERRVIKPLSLQFRPDQIDAPGSRRNRRVHLSAFRKTEVSISIFGIVNLMDHNLT
jgi:hypothetical protein